MFLSTMFRVSYIWTHVVKQGGGEENDQSQYETGHSPPLSSKTSLINAYRGSATESLRSVTLKTKDVDEYPCEI